MEVLEVEMRMKVEVKVVGSAGMEAEGVGGCIVGGWWWRRW